LRTIEIIVSSKGETQVETKGFTGDSCREASKFIESALGKVSNEQLKPEFHESSSSSNIVENSN